LNSAHKIKILEAR